MRLFPCFIILLIVFNSCNKTASRPANPNHCLNLINDTTATNDSTYIEVPNAFSPNEDAINDKWIIRMRNVLSLHYIIYDENNAIADSGLYSISNPPDELSLMPTDSNYIHDYYTIEALTTTNNTIGQCGDLYIFFQRCHPKNFDVSLLHFDPTNLNLSDDPVTDSTCN